MTGLLVDLNESLKSENESLRTLNAVLKAENEALKQENEVLRSQLDAALRRLQELEDSAGRFRRWRGSRRSCAHVSSVWTCLTTAAG